VNIEQVSTVRHKDKSIVHRYFTIIVYLLAFTALNFAQGQVKEGDTLDHVIEVLGEPGGIIKSDTETVYVFDRGEVTVVNGVVKAVELLPQNKRYSEIAAKAAVSGKVYAQQQREAGQRELELLVASRSYVLADPDLKLERLRLFSKHYPDVDTRVAIKEANKELKEKMARIEEDAGVDRENRQRAYEMEAQQSYISLIQYQPIYHMIQPDFDQGSGFTRPIHPHCETPSGSRIVIGF